MAEQTKMLQIIPNLFLKQEELEEITETGWRLTITRMPWLGLMILMGVAALAAWKGCHHVV